jgi:hypothetical protein
MEIIEQYKITNNTMQMFNAYVYLYNNRELLGLSCSEFLNIFKKSEAFILDLHNKLVDGPLKSAFYTLMGYDFLKVTCIKNNLLLSIDIKLYMYVISCMMHMNAANTLEYDNYLNPLTFTFWPSEIVPFAPKNFYVYINVPNPIPLSSLISILNTLVPIPEISYNYALCNEMRNDAAYSLNKFYIYSATVTIPGIHTFNHSFTYFTSICKVNNNKPLAYICITNEKKPCLNMKTLKVRTSHFHVKNNSTTKLEDIMLNWGKNLHCNRVYVDFEEECIISKHQPVSFMPCFIYTCNDCHEFLNTFVDVKYLNSTLRVKNPNKFKSLHKHHACSKASKRYYRSKSLITTHNPLPQEQIITFPPQNNNNKIISPQDIFLINSENKIIPLSHYHLNNNTQILQSSTSHFNASCQQQLTQEVHASSTLLQPSTSKGYLYITYFHT